MNCAAHNNVIFCSSVVDRLIWEQLNFLNLIAPNSPVITGTIFVLTFHILLTSISTSLYVVSFSVYFLLKFKLSGVAISISRQVFSLLSFSTVSGQFASIVRSMKTGSCHIMVVPLTFMALSVVA